MDIKLSEEQIKQLSQALSIRDVLSCVVSNYDSYIDFLTTELKSNELTEAEYNNELLLIEKIIKQEKETLENGYC